MEYPFTADEAIKIISNLFPGDVTVHNELPVWKECLQQRTLRQKSLEHL